MVAGCDTRPEEKGMSSPDLGANEFSLAGDRTRITFLTQGPGPVHPGQSGGRLEYAGAEGDFTFTGSQIGLERSPLGTLVTVVLKANNDTGGITVTVLLPHITGVSRSSPVSFTTVAIKASSRGFIRTPGADLTYTVVPMLGTAKDVIVPFEQTPAASEASTPAS
jgi:hypothetical protein